MDENKRQSMERPQVKKGYIQKQGQMFRSWKNRFFVLSEGHNFVIPHSNLFNK